MGELGSMCPNCGSSVTDDACPDCDFKFSTVLNCPNKSESNKCTKKESDCRIIGMDYECCPVLRGDE